MRRRVMIESIRIPPMANIYKQLFKYTISVTYTAIVTHFTKHTNNILFNILLEKLQVSKVKRVSCAVESLQGCPGPRAGCLPGSCKGGKGRPWEDILTLLPCGHFKSDFKKVSCYFTTWELGCPSMLMYAWYVFKS